jgi:hypothetical protein
VHRQIETVRARLGGATSKVQKFPFAPHQ